MNHLKFLAVIVGIALVIGCAGTRPGSGYVDDVPNGIQRLIAENHSNDLYAVGTAKSLDEGTAIRKATLQARAMISRQFKTRVSALQKNYGEDLNTQVTGEFINVIDELTSVELTGSKMIKSMVRIERNKTISAKVLVVVSSEQLKTLIDEKLRDYTTFRASNAYKELLKRLELE